MINAKNSDVSNYISPLKLFSIWLQNIIIASKIPAYAHILKIILMPFWLIKIIYEWSQN